MPLTLEGDFAAQHLSTGQILTEVLNIVRDNASKLDRINSELEILKEQVSSMSTERKNAQLISLHTTSSTKGQSSLDSSCKTDQQDCVETITPKSKQDSANAPVQISQNGSLKTTVSDTKQASMSTSTPTSEQSSADMAMSLTKLNQIKKLVEEYNSSRDVRELKEGLLLVLDKNSEAYKQLNEYWYNITNSPSFDIGYHGYLELATVLIEAGLDVDSADGSGFTMLHGSIYTENIALVQYLLNRGADVNLCYHNGDPPLLYASRRDNLAIVKLLVERGADVNWANNSGYTSLHEAARSGMSEIVECLVEAGADTKAKAFTADSLKTPLDFAKRERHNRVIEYLSKFTD